MLTLKLNIWVPFSLHAEPRLCHYGVKAAFVYVSELRACCAGSAGCVCLLAFKVSLCAAVRGFYVVDLYRVPQLSVSAWVLVKAQCLVRPLNACTWLQLLAGDATGVYLSPCAFCSRVFSESHQGHPS